MDRPACACAPEVFRTVYRLCVRLSRKTRFLPYLCAVHTPGAEHAVQRLLPVLHGGEVLSAVQPDLVYVLCLPSATRTRRPCSRACAARYPAPTCACSASAPNEPPFPGINI